MHENNGKTNFQLQEESSVAIQLIDFHSELYPCQVISNNSGQVLLTKKMKIFVKYVEKQFCSKKFLLEYIDDRQYVINYLSQKPSKVILRELILKHWMKDMEIILILLEQDRSIFDKLPKDVRCDEDVSILLMKQKRMVRISSTAFSKLTEKSKSYLLEHIDAIGPFLFGKLSETLRNDAEIVLTYMKINYYHQFDIINLIGKELRNDKQFVLKVLYETNVFVGLDELQHDKEIIDHVFKRWKEFKVLPKYSRYFHSLFCDEFDVIIYILSKGHGLECASERLRDNEQIVRHAVKQNPKSLHYASQRLNCDPKFILDLINEKLLTTLEYVKEIEILGGMKFVEKAQSINPHIETPIQYVTNEMLIDMAVVHKIDISDYHAKITKELALKIVSLNGQSYRLLPLQLICDVDVAITAWKTDTSIFQDIPKQLWTNDFLLRLKEMSACYEELYIPNKKVKR